MTQNSNASRRTLLVAGVASVVPLCLGAERASAATADPFVGSRWRKLTDAEWKKRLSPAAFDVLRRDGTEAPGSSPLNDEYGRGAFVCGGCGLPLFKSEWKFHSGTGWPSFYTAIQTNIRTKRDTQLLEVRTEYHCARCLGHQGHIFNDGPKPTGLRYCNDGVSLRFIPS